MMLLELLTYSLLWYGCTAVPIWGYYQNPGPYELKRVQQYEPRSAWQRGQQEVEDRPSFNLGYEYNAPLLRYEDSMEENEWSDEEYNKMNEMYNKIDDAWSERGMSWPQRSRGYSTEEDVGYGEMSKALPRWQKQEAERNARYVEDPDNFYIQVDDDSNEWQPETADTALLERLLAGRQGLEDRSIDDERYEDGLDVFQKIGMRLVDLTDEKESEDVKSRESEEVEELGDVAEKEEDEEEIPLTKDKAKSLLKQLQEVENERETAGDEPLTKEEPVDKEELEAMFNKESSSDESTEVSENSDPAENAGSKRETENILETVEELQETELELAKEENQLLIEVLRRTPIELIRSPQTVAQVKALIASAASRQELIDYIDSKISEKGFN